MRTNEKVHFSPHQQQRTMDISNLIHDDESIIDLTDCYFSKAGEKYKITKFLTAETLKIRSILPDQFDSSPNGIATLLISKNSTISTNGENSSIAMDNRSSTEVQKFSHSQLSNGPYSLRYINPRTTTVKFKNSSVKATRYTADCSGVLCCRYSHPFIAEECSEKTHFSSSLDQKKARDIFFYGQNNFICRKHGSQRQEKDNYFSLQRKKPEWVFRVGKTVSEQELFSRQSLFGIIDHNRHSSKLDDYIGCRLYGTHGNGNEGEKSSKCSILRLPAALQGANEDLVNKILSDADMMEFPSPPVEHLHRCPPLSVKYRGKHCPRAIHDWEAVPLDKVKCGVRYYAIIPQEKDWMVVVGCGKHTHGIPPPTIDHRTQRSLVMETMRHNPMATVHNCADKVLEATGKQPSLEAIRKVRYEFKKSEHPYGLGLDALQKEVADLLNTGHIPYVKSILDNRNTVICPSGENSTIRSLQEDGVIITMCHDELLKHMVATPQIGCDGTFSMVTKESDNLSLELLCFVAKDITTGRIYVPFRALTSKKTTGARKAVFMDMVTRMKDLGLPDPLTALPASRLCMGSDFETTFAIALCQVLVEVFRPDYDMVETSKTYMEIVCYGCEVHAKRTIMKKTGKDIDSPLFKWIMGTRRFIGPGTPEFVLQEISSKGPVWNTFSKWLDSNYAAKVLWFLDYYKDKHGSQCPSYFMYTTNPNESHNSKLKSSPSYALTKCNGLPLVQLVSLMYKMDNDEYNNIIGTYGRQTVAVPSFRRTIRGKKRERVEKVSIDGYSVHASEPKMRKKKN